MFTNKKSFVLMSFHVLSTELRQLLIMHVHTHRVLQRAWSHVSRQTIMLLTRTRKKHRIFVACDDTLRNR